jgi:hypothetical protein
VPLLIGELENDGSFIAVDVPTIEGLLAVNGIRATPDEVRAQYPGLNESQVIAKAFRDIAGRWWVILLDERIVKIVLVVETECSATPLFKQGSPASFVIHMVCFRAVFFVSFSYLVQVRCLRTSRSFPAQEHGMEQNVSQ